MTDTPAPEPTPPPADPAPAEPAPARLGRARRARGLRGFAKEVAIVVLGVLIALSAQEAVQWWHWRGDVAEARAALNHELASNRARLQFMARQDRCYDARLAALERWAVQPNRPVIASMTPATFWNLHTSAWEVTKTGQTAAQLPLADRLAYSQVYAVLEAMQGLIQDEAVTYRSMVAVVLGPRAADPDGTRLLTALAQLRGYTRARRNNHPTLERYFHDLAVQPDTGSMRWVVTQDVCAPPVFAPPRA